MAITAKSPTLKILKNAVMEYGVTGDIAVAGKSPFLAASPAPCHQKVKFPPKPKPLKIFLAISAYFAESEKESKKFILKVLSHK